MGVSTQDHLSHYTDCLASHWGLFSSASTLDSLTASHWPCAYIHLPFPEWVVEQLLGPETLIVPALFPPKGCRSQHFEGTLCRLATPPSFVYDY